MDRKAWIILTICGILLALNFYYKPEPPQPAPVTTQPENGGQSSTANDNKSATGVESAAAPQGELFNEPPVPAVGENIETLTSKNEDGEARMVRTLLNLLSHRVVVVSKLPPY
jgi:hypothetical protein